MRQRTIQAAAVQMDVRPAPLDERLTRADQQICDAVELGADLVVLPEMFNTGYAYTDDNFRHAEPPDGLTISWLKRTAKRRHTHLAGTLLVLEGGEIYNSMFIVSPDGRSWRYDKSYPWGWERAYFRENRAQGPARAMVAQTDLGDLGMMICWDVAHSELWQAYAGKVDMMVICSCPPQMTNPTFWLPDGQMLTADELGPVLAGNKTQGERVFGEVINQQAAWVGVPVVNSAGCGQFDSPIPNATGSLMTLLPGKPSLARYLPQAAKLQIRANMIEACKVVDARGKPVARVPQSRGEAFAVGEVTLADTHPHPSGPQPETGVPGILYTMADSLLPRLSRGVYEHGIKQIRSK